MENWNPRYNDRYFTPDGGMKESQHIFFDGNRLAERLPERLCNPEASFTIIETGFGSGLNIYLCAALACEMKLHGTLRFYSVEKHPLVQ